MLRLSTLLFLVALLSGCASNVPKLISERPQQELNYLQARENLQTHLGSDVRWGGRIISVENETDTTLIEILDTRLGSFGRPRRAETYQGRFIARIDGFLDPEYYKEDRFITVYGRLDGQITQPIDEHEYNYPLVQVNEYYLWPEYQMRRDPYGYPYNYYYPGFYRPGFYRPYFYPWQRYPYW